MKHRTATVTRDTRETQIEVKLDLDGTGRAAVATGERSWAFLAYSAISLDVTANARTCAFAAVALII